jgi:multidrug efflux pump subunit AcrB
MIRYFAHHPTAANLLMLGFILLGVLGILAMTREVFPEFSADQIKVEVVYKGASADEIEETIARRIEDEIQGVEGIEEIESVSRESRVELTIEVADGYDPVEVLSDVENEVDQIDNLPENSEEPQIWEVKQQDNVMTITLVGDLAAKDLYTLAEQTKDDLLRLDDVNLVQIEGFSDHEIRIEVNDAALRGYGLTVGDVARAIEMQSIDLPAGSIETAEREIKIRLVDQRKWAEDFRDLPVVTSLSGARIPLRAFAKVTDTFENDWQFATFRGQRAANLHVRKTQDQDTITAANAVKAFVEQRKQTLPPGIEMRAWGDWSDPVRDRLGMLVENGLLGFILVFFMLWLFLHLRLSFWVAVGIPISFLGTLYVLDITGMSLNMITMFSLILALGIIVDDAIVISENVYAHYQRGKSSLDAAVDGTREVGLGVLSSMLTTIAIFMPLLMMTGEIGKVMRVMPVGVVAALSVSLIEGFFILPNHLSHSLGRIKEPNRVRRTIDGGVNWFTEHVYGRFLSWAVKHRVVPVAGILALFLIAVGQLVGGRLKFVAFPELDGDILVAYILMPRGTDEARTQEVVDRVEAGLEAVNDHFKPMQPDDQDLIKLYSTIVGVNVDADERGSHAATITVELLASDERTGRCDDIIAMWKEKVGELPDVVSLIYDQMQVTPGGKDIDIQLRGEQLDTLKQAGLVLQEKLSGYPGVRNVTDNLRAGKMEVFVRLKPASRSLGVSAADLAQQLRDGFWGATAQEFQRGSENFQVVVQFQNEDRASLADLDDFKVRTSRGDAVPFHEVATAEIVRGYAKIVRVDRQRTVSVTGDVDSRKGNAANILQEMETDFLPKLTERFAGVSVNFEGQRKETAKTAASVQTGFVIGLAMIFILLSFVFESYIEPVVVMAAIPLGAIGSIFGHQIMGIDWTIPSTIGFISLAGIVVNDSIVLVQFIKIQRQAGASINEAVVEAGKRRFRAVCLTSATTVAGLSPMMMEASLQAQFLVPMAVSIAFGLLFATVLVLVLVPCLYSGLTTILLRIRPNNAH